MLAEWHALGVMYAEAHRSRDGEALPVVRALFRDAETAAAEVGVNPAVFMSAMNAGRKGEPLAQMWYAPLTGRVTR